MDSSYWNILSAIIAQSIATLVQLIILIIYTISFLKRLRNSKSGDVSEAVSYKLELLNIFALFVLLLQTVAWLLNYTGAFTTYTNMDCDSVFLLCYLLWFYYNASLYSIYAARLHVVYDRTPFELSKLTKMVIWIALILFVIITTITPYIQIYIGNIVKSVHFDISTVCWGYDASVDFFLIGYTFTMTVFSCTTMVLFVKPLCILYSKTATNEHVDVQLLKLSTKYSVLTLITIVSSALAGIGHVIIAWPFIAGVCVLIQAFCIMLYAKRFQILYDVFCWKVNDTIEKRTGLTKQSTVSSIRRSVVISSYMDENVPKTTQTVPGV